MIESETERRRECLLLGLYYTELAEAMEQVAHKTRRIGEHYNKQAARIFQLGNESRG